MKTLIRALLIATLLPVAATAHHSFVAEWDANNCRDFVGTLTKIDWQNPHPYFYVDIKDASGKIENWSFQAYSPVTLRRNGTDRQVFLDNVGKEVNSPEQFIANFTGNGDAGHYIKLSARNDGSFTVTNARNRFTKEYPVSSPGVVTSSR